MTDEATRDQAIQRFEQRVRALGQVPAQALGRHVDSKQCGGELHLDSGGAIESCRALVTTTFGEARAVALESLVIGRHDRVVIGQPGEKTYLTVVDLTLDSLGSLELLGNVDILVAGTLEQLPADGGDEPRKPGDDHIGIELFPGIVLCQIVGPLHGKGGAAGASGQDGPNGKDGFSGRTHKHTAICVKAATRAEHGRHGRTGSPGESGAVGQAVGQVVCEAAVIAGELLLYAGGGHGGQGGAGGAGGKGGDGGDVKPRGLCGTPSDTPGGSGGHGGRGGNGGAGGDGGDGGSLTLRYRELRPGATIAVRRRRASGGMGAPGGAPGRPGRGGVFDGIAGKATYGNGSPGAPGKAGTSGERGSPTVITLVQIS